MPKTFDRFILLFVILVIKKEKLDNNIGKDEDMDEEVEVVNQEDEQLNEEKEEEEEEEADSVDEEVQTEHINVTPELKVSKQVTAQTVAQRKTLVKTTQDIRCTELESDEEEDTKKLNPKESAFVSGDTTTAPCAMELLSDDEMEAKAKVTTPPSSASKKK